MKYIKRNKYALNEGIFDDDDMSLEDMMNDFSDSINVLLKKMTPILQERNVINPTTRIVYGKEDKKIHIMLETHDSVRNANGTMERSLFLKPFGTIKLRTKEFHVSERQDGKSAFITELNNALKEEGYNASFSREDVIYNIDWDPSMMLSYDCFPFSIDFTRCDNSVEVKEYINSFHSNETHISRVIALDSSDTRFSVFDESCKKFAVVNLWYFNNKSNANSSDYYKGIENLFIDIDNQKNHTYYDKRVYFSLPTSFIPDDEKDMEFIENDIRTLLEYSTEYSVLVAYPDDVSQRRDARFLVVEMLERILADYPNVELGYGNYDISCNGGLPRYSFKVMRPNNNRNTIGPNRGRLSESSIFDDDIDDEEILRRDREEQEQIVIKRIKEAAVEAFLKDPLTTAHMETSYHGIGDNIEYHIENYIKSKTNWTRLWNTGDLTKKTFNPDMKDLARLVNVRYNGKSYDVWFGIKIAWRNVDKISFGTDSLQSMARLHRIGQYIRENTGAACDIKLYFDEREAENLVNVSNISDPDFMFNDYKRDPEANWLKFITFRYNLTGSYTMSDFLKYITKIVNLPKILYMLSLPACSTYSDLYEDIPSSAPVRFKEINFTGSVGLRANNDEAEMASKYAPGKEEVESIAARFLKLGGEVTIGSPFSGAAFERKREYSIGVFDNAICLNLLGEDEDPHKVKTFFTLFGNLKSAFTKMKYDLTRHHIRMCSLGKTPCSISISQSLELLFAREAERKRGT